MTIGELLVQYLQHSNESSESETEEKHEGDVSEGAEGEEYWPSASMNRPNQNWYKGHL